MKPIVYTCVYGDYDDLKDQPDIGADYICFTDNPYPPHQHGLIKVIGVYNGII